MTPINDKVNSQSTGIILFFEDLDFDILDIDQFHEYIMLSDPDWFWAAIEPIRYLQSYKEVLNQMLVRLRQSRFGVGSP